MTDSSPLATILERQGEALLDVWVKRVRAELGDDGKSQVELRDHIPLVLEDLAQALRSGACPPAMTRRDAASAHGRQRFRLGFDVEQLVREYALLHNLILDVVVDQDVPLTVSGTRVLLDFFTKAIAEGVTEHEREADRNREVVRAEAEEMQATLRTKEFNAAADAMAKAAELRLVTDALPVLVSFVDGEERYRMVNKAYGDWFGAPSDSLLGRKVREVIGEAAYAKLAPHIARGLAGERFSFEEYGVPYRLGGTRDIKVSFCPHFDGTGRQGGYVALIEDITSHRQLQRERDALALERTEVIESMGDAFWAVDAEWRVVLVNAQFERWSRKTRAETLGKSLWDLFPEARDPASVYYRIYHQCMSSREPARLLDYYAPLDTWIDVRLYPTGTGGICAFFRDVSEEKRVETSLRDRSEFEQQLIGIVSHDLRNPLNVIVMASSLLARSDELDDASLKMVVRIQNAAHRATHMVSDLLDFTRARLGGGIGVEPRPTNLHEVVAKVIEEVEAAHPLRHVVYQHAGDGQGEWDPERIGQVVQNLVTNALKYSPESSTVEVWTQVGADAATLTVHNAGAPIPAPQLEAIFEPFERAGKIDKASRSVGLGLYIVREIATAHGGSVGVTSNASEGTTFTVTLPRRRELAGHAKVEPHA